LKHNLSILYTTVIPLAEIPQTKSSQPIGKLCHKKRRPCHGWISDDDEEEGELIELPALYKLVNGVPMKKKLVDGVK